MSRPTADNPPFSSDAEVWAYLARVTDYERMTKFGKGRVEWDLATIRELVEAIGRPDRRFRIVHVGGSKGKGSTARLVRDALRASGVRTGLYTSPHVDGVLERIDVDGSSLQSDDFVALMNRLYPAIERAAVAPTFFEIFTALGLLAFAEAGVEVAVLEVGLGGRLDATNVVERPAVTVLTSVSRDHTHLLGDTVTEIAADKAGMIRPNTPVVTGVRPGEAALPPILDAASEARAPIAVRERDFGVTSWEPRGAGATLSLWSGRRRIDAIPFGPGGAFQARNAAVALAALDALAAGGGPAVDDETLRAAWSATRIPGRFEIRLRPDDRVLVIDGAHNEASATALLDALTRHFPGRRRILVFGMAGDKTVEETAAPLFRAAAKIHVTATDNPRSVDGPALVALAERLGSTAVAHDDAAAAMRAALGDARPGDSIVVTGSLYLVGEVRDWLEAEAGAP